MRRLLTLFIGVATLGLALSPSPAQTVEEFYKKTPLSVYVGSGAGGGFDEIARAFIAHFASHVPGNPAVSIKNQPGAGGLVNANFIYNEAPRDGSAIAAAVDTAMMLPIYGEPAAKFDPRQFTWLGSIGKVTGICVVWHTSSLHSLEEARQREVLVSATGLAGSPAVFPNVLNALIGTRFKTISGYSTNEMRLALERGEVEGICGLGLETYETSAPEWLADKKIRVVAQLGLVPNKKLPGVPMATDLIQNEADRNVFELIVLPKEFGRPFIAPPGIPADRAAALRKAFDDTLTDPAFISDAARIHLTIDPMEPDDIARWLDRAYAVPKDQAARAGKFSGVQ
jgi:tripartite-type tricarboxylate transporter receptor subunit TctC